MTNNWRQKYTELINFIAEHPEIKIEESRIIIPESVRPDFYQLFNTIRTLFVGGEFTELLNKVNTLNREYMRVEAEATKLLELEDISIERPLHKFLSNGVDELARGLWDQLFDLLKGRVDTEAFERRASSSINGSFRGLYNLGYERWVAISLIKLLEADKLFQVTPREFYSDYAQLYTGVSTAKEDIAPPEESKRISFDHPLTTTFIAPSFIVHSPKVNGYFALRSTVGEALVEATDASKTREWHDLDSIAVPTSGITFIYLADKPEEISLIADKTKFCRPDLVIICEGNRDWYRAERMNEIRMQHSVLKPVLGTYTVSHEDVPEWVSKNFVSEESVALTSVEKGLKPNDTKQAGIHALTVGFNQFKLLPIISVMLNHRKGRNNDN